MIKRPNKPLMVYFSPEEREILKGLAERDRRDLANEIRWLVVAYAKGELVTLGELKSLLNRYEKEIPVLRGELEQYVSEGTPEQHDRRSKTARRSQK